VPIVPGIALPEELFEIDQHKIVCLNIDPDVLQKIRKVRQKNSGLRPSYSDLKNVFAEVEYVWDLARKHQNWTVVDTTNKSVEETAWRSSTRSLERNMTNTASSEYVRAAYTRKIPRRNS